MDVEQLGRLWLTACLAVTVGLLVSAVFSIPVRTRAERRRWAQAMKKAGDIRRGYSRWQTPRKP